jgi:hypothetical protein
MSASEGRTALDMQEEGVDAVASGLAGTLAHLRRRHAEGAAEVVPLL